MELRQLRYFVRIVELGSMSRAALDLDMVQSALSQQVSRLESELSTRLLQRTPRGVVPTEAGVAFFREAQLTLRHAEQAVRSAQQARLSGSVSVGLAPTTSAMLGLPMMQAMRARYPDVRLHMVEGMSGHLTDMLNARALDMAVLFDARLHGGQARAGGRRWQVHPLIEEELFLIRARGHHPEPLPPQMALADLAGESLILPTGLHGLRSTLDTAFSQARFTPHLVLEVDSLSMVMAAVDAGLGSTVQPWASMGRYADAAQRFEWSRITDKDALRTNLLCSLSEDELSPAALAARVVLIDCVRQLLRGGAWAGTALIHHED
ncbi:MULTISPECIES: LysR substrate-binding domain-containing protein [Delftia]|jgi:LysR family tcuABC transcriptional regulator|uniref:Transcriptional regulator, LysR family n=5 Tax=Delftia TaxID=80865 RepID=A9BS31_DELAS|nr:MULTISPECIES: LysR substrate-binding domain-containing protein [Delftia]KAA9167384.1 LysR family transcriptional regulator [Delftia sp. BR1]KEH12539.1 LysR family transcriptional regulator [Delftia sp. 670]OLE93502.1 MAG: LysR family transcriptional regulator [Delftia sp. 13_1_40CM_3_66_6]PIF40320.1 LysR family tcuABC transcriptional regulator [Burkholderiales bacterium 23]ABX33441.1 transcriptional regulator, LysR family [Delftia acidovorans SPH-1]